MKPTENLSSQIKSIITLTTHWQKTMPKKPRKLGSGPEWREWEGLTIVLDNFKEFAANYETILQQAPLPIQRFTINKGVENLLQGFSVISRACEQRRGKITTDSLGYYLAQAEDVLEMYCSQWKGQKYGSPYLELRTPIAYFEKLFGISRSLYAPNIPIVSIPITMYNNPDLWLALAHEIGHHIYWNSLDSYEEMDEFQARVSSTISQTKSAKIWEGWTEEVFADICGTLLAGPSYVISCQNTAAEKARKPADLAKNDGEHPAGYLRPLIALQVIHEIEKNDNTDFIKSIENRWLSYTKGVEHEICKTTHLVSDMKEGQEDLTLEKLASEIKPIVHAILNEGIWPGNNNLLNLVPPNNEQVVELEDLDNLVLIEQEEQKTIIQQKSDTRGPDENDMTGNVRKLWKFLRGLVSTKKPTALEEWDKFLDLSLDENHGHWLAGAHENCKTHLIYTYHKHDQGGSGTMINC